MIAWWMAQLALLGTLLAVAAYGAESALTVARKQTRWVWAAALGMTVLLGALAPTRLTDGALPERDWASTDVAPANAAANTLAPTLVQALQAQWSGVTVAIATQVQRGWSTWHRVMPGTAEYWLLATWLAASAALLLAFAAVHIRYQRRRAQWPLGTVHGTTVRIAHDTGPAVIGVTSAEIVVPQWLLGRDDKEQQLVLDHELEHVRQHDPLLLAAAQVAVILLPWHPAVWWMASRLRLAIELDCDRRVLARGGSARDYGTLLIDLTDHRTGFGAALPAFSCSPSHLERRLVAMTPKRLKYPLVRALSTGAIASLALLAACEAKLPTADEMDEMTVATATAAAGRVALVDTATVTYFLNEVPVSKAEAERIAAENIASVNVLQKGKQRGGEVRIVTRNGKLAADSNGSARINYVRTDPTAVTVTTPGSSITLIADTTTLARTGQRSEGREPLVAAAGTFLRERPLFAPATPAGSPRTGFTGLMVVDGVITDPSEVNKLAPDLIASVQILKGAAATALYSDPRAANGVIQITTKRGKI